MQKIFKHCSVNVFILGALLFGFVPLAQADVPIIPQIVWQQKATFDHEYIGQSQAVAVDASEQYVYFGSGSRLYSADIHTTPGHINVMHETDTLHGSISQIVVVGNYAYVAAVEAGFLILDVSNPLLPQEVGSYTFNGDNAFHVQVANQRAYVAASYNGVTVLNVSNPASPTLVSNFASPRSFQALKLVGNVLYALDYHDGLFIYNITNPANVVFVQNIPLSVLTNPYSMTINGNYAYVGDEIGEIAIVDLTSKAVTKIQPANNIVYDLDAVSGKLYLAVDSQGICTLNILDFGAITDVCTFTPGPFLYPKSVRAMASGRIYAAYSDGLRILNPLPGTQGGYVFSVREPQDGAVLNGKIYVTSRDGLAVMDETTGNLLGKLANPPGGGLSQITLSVQSSTTYAITNDSMNNIYVFDVSNPASITQKGSPFVIPNNLYSGRIQVVGTTLYVIGNTSTNGYLYVINMANPASLSQIAQITLPGSSNGYLSMLAWTTAGTPIIPPANHRVALITGYSQGIDVVDVSNPAYPIFHSIPKPANNLIWSVTAAPGGLNTPPPAIYMGTGTGIQVYSYPDLLYQGTISTNYIADIVVKDGYLVSLGGPGIYFYSLVNPLAPTQFAYADVPGIPTILVPGAPYQVMSVDQKAGLQIVDLQTYRIRLPVVKR